MTTAHPIKALLSLYDEAYQGKFGVRAPIKPGRDCALAKQLLGIYTLDQLGDWLKVFFILHDPFVQQSGYEFHIFSCCIGKCITAKPLTPVKPPPAELVELAKSLARANAEQAEQDRIALYRRERELLAQGLAAPDAVIQASREWLRGQK